MKHVIQDLQIGKVFYMVDSNVGMDDLLLMQ